jgi:hypothetical protein
LGNDIARGGQEGVHGTRLTSSLIQGNRIHDNNTEQFEPTWEAGGLKMTKLDGVTIDGNESFHNDGPGLWCDIDCTHTTISNNRVHHNYGRWGQGIIYEISHYGTIRGNAVWENGWDYTTWGWGAGIVVQNSDHTEVVGNTVAWNGDGISVVSQDRGGSWNNVVENYVHGNIVVSTNGGPKAMGWYQDWTGVLYAAASNNRGADNAYWYPTAEGSDGRFEWAGGLRYLADFNATPGEEGGRYLSASAKDSALAAVGIPGTPEAH